MDVPACTPCLDRSTISPAAIEMDVNGAPVGLCEMHARAWASLRSVEEEDAILAILDDDER